MLKTMFCGNPMQLDFPPFNVCGIISWGEWYDNKTYHHKVTQIFAWLIILFFSVTLNIDGVWKQSIEVVAIS